MNNEKGSGDRTEIIANRMYLNRDRWKHCARRTPRAEVDPSLHSLRIAIKNTSELVLPVRTIGELGAYCVHPAAQGLDLKPDQKLDLALLIEGESFDLAGSIRYVKADGFGLEFSHPPELAQEKIRNLLGPELLAATLNPFMTRISMEPGATWTLIYSDGDANYLHISLAEQKLLAVDLELEILGLGLLWRKAEGSPAEAFRHRGNRSVAAKRVLSFLRNLPGLAADYFREIEVILGAGSAS